MARSTLLVRIAEPADLGLPVVVPGGAAALVGGRLGETVILAHSDAPGIWFCVGRARFKRLVHRAGAVLMEFDRVERFEAQVASIVDAGDAFGAPYAFEEVPPEEMARIEGLAGGALHAPAAPSFAEDGQAPFADAPVGPAKTASPLFDPAAWLDRVVAPGSDLHALARERYRNHCAITGLPLSLPGGLREGFVVPVHFGGSSPRALSEVMPLTGTMAFLYAHGLVAATDGLALWLHPQLPAEIAALVAELNPAMRLRVPAEPGDWPLAALLGRHLAEARA